VKQVLRFVGGLIVGVVGSGTVADWLFALFDWLNVEIDPTKSPLGPVGWGAALATWAASSFVGQAIAANVAQVPAIIWFVAAIDAVVLFWAYTVEPHPALLVGAALGFLVAFRLKDSDLLRMGEVLPATR
jgi:hypothetical protein